MLRRTSCSTRAENRVRPPKCVLMGNSLGFRRFGVQGFRLALGLGLVFSQPDAGVPECPKHLKILKAIASVILDA